MRRAVIQTPSTPNAIWLRSTETEIGPEPPVARRDTSASARAGMIASSGSGTGSSITVSLTARR